MLKAAPIGGGVWVRIRGGQVSLSSLRIRLLLLVMLAVIPALGLIVYTAIEHRRDAIADVQETALRVARLAATEQGRRIASAGELLVALAQLREVRLHEAARCSMLFAEVIKRYPLYLNLGAIKPNGDLFCSALTIQEPINLADRAYFKRAVASRDFAVGDYQIGRATKKASVNVAYPVLGEEGAVSGVVFAAIDLAGLNQLVREARLPERSTFTVVDRQGTVLVRHPDPERWVGKALPDAPDLAVVRALGTGVAEAAGSDGIPRLLGFVPLFDGGEAGDVFASIGIPKDVAIAGANRLLAWNLATLTVVGILAMAAAWYGGDAFVVRKVNRLVEATRRLAAGDLAARTGAVIDDFRRNLVPLGLELYLYDARVEGARAVEEVTRGIRWFNEHMPDLDVLVIMRGGGSLEDLQAFDNEKVARAIFASKIPVITSIGHHRDITIASLTGDVETSTPSFAATAINGSWSRLTEELPVKEQRLLRFFERIFDRAAEFEARLKAELRRIEAQNAEMAARGAELLRFAVVRLERLLKDGAAGLSRLEAHLKSSDPRRNLRLGYSILLSSSGKVVKAPEDISIGERITARLDRGELDAKVERIRKYGTE